MKDFEFCVFIARLQPPHRAHVEVMKQALDRANSLIIVCGSDRSAPTIRNPFTFDEREEMVRRCFDYDINKRIHFVSVRDQPYNNTNWLASVHQKVVSITGGAKTCLIGHRKDHTSFYLDMFPQWEFVEIRLLQQGLSATDIREQYFEDGPDGSKAWRDRDWQQAVHEGVKDFLTEFRESPRFKTLHETFMYVQDYKKSWEAAPFPPTFTTTDVVLVKLGHVLLIRRGHNPGKGLVALPGGFLQEGFTLVESSLNELKEETRIKVDRRVLREHIKDKEVFDAPGRSVRGRTITHAFFIKLPDEGYLPEVKGGDDAVGAFWCPLGDLRHMETEFNEDHLDIIEHFTKKA